MAEGSAASSTVAVLGATVAGMVVFVSGGFFFDFFVFGSPGSDVGGEVRELLKQMTGRTSFVNTLFVGALAT